MDQDELDRLERERREKEQAALAAQEAENYARVHAPLEDAEVTQETEGQE